VRGVIEKGSEDAYARHEAGHFVFTIALSRLKLQAFGQRPLAQRLELKGLPSHQAWY
jgi:hypothetical protein